LRGEAVPNFETAFLAGAPPGGVKSTAGVMRRRVPGE